MEEVGLKREFLMQNEFSTQRTTCRSCNTALRHVLVDLGSMPPSNAYLGSAAAIAAEKAFPLQTVVCDRCWLVQLDHDVAPEYLFHDYAYFSSYSESWLAHCRAYAEMAIKRFALGANSLVIELASNDGYLLKNFVESKIPVLGVDPSDTVAKAAIAAGVPTEIAFFGRQTAERLAARGLAADLVAGKNVLAHVPDPNDFVAGIPLLLKPNGSITIEFPHLLKLIQHVEFDTIYHEHFSYLSLLAVEALFARHGLRVYDVDELKTHGGSLRIYGCHAADARPEGAGLHKVRAAERQARLDNLEAYDTFRVRVEKCRTSLQAFLAKARAQGKRVAGYGAAAKGNTLLNYCGVTQQDLPFVADRSPHKQNKLLPGTHIPIKTPDQLLAERPDFVLILPWNLADEVVQQLAAVRQWGGQFVVPIPEAQIIT